jgi:hypothetical protein
MYERVIDMKHNDAETDEFIQQFSDFPHHRQNIVTDLIARNNRLFLNIPGYGPARQISAHLRKGPFSVFYEFEKTLARVLHPVLAGLNLNMISDIMINGLFTEKYHFYARDINFILAANKKLSLDVLKKVILGMVERDGHFMVVKFYDLVVRVIDADLFRALKPVELCLINMKNNLGDGDSENTGKILTIYRSFRKTHRDAAAHLLLKRMEWDQKVVSYLPSPEEDPDFKGISPDVPSDTLPEAQSGTDNRENEPEHKPESDETAGESIATGQWEDRVARYAGLIKRGYLIKKEPADEEGIQKIVEGMFIKNEKVSGGERAADIVRDVLAIWIKDDSLDEGMHRTLIKIRDERRSLPAQEEEYALENNEATADESDKAGTDTIDDYDMIETTPVEEKTELIEAGVSDEEMNAILKGISDEPVLQDESSEGDTDVSDSLNASEPALHEIGVATDLTDDGDAAESSPVITGNEPEAPGGDEKFLISEDEIPEMTKAKPHPEGDEMDGNYLISDEEMVVAIPGDVPEEVSADQSFIEEMIAADEFVVQDELLYEDKSLKRKYRKNGKKPGEKL